MADKVFPIATQDADNRLAAAPDGTLLQVPLRKIPPDLSDALKRLEKRIDDLEERLNNGK